MKTEIFSPGVLRGLDFARPMPNKKHLMPNPFDPVAQEMGARLKRARESQGLTQEQLAKMASVAGPSLRQSAIANFEAGTRRIRRDAALALERVLSQPAGYFLCVLDEEEAAIIKAVRTSRYSNTRNGLK